MMKKNVYQLSKDEYSEIVELFDKKTALEILFNTISETSNLYEKLLNDYQETIKKYNQWWEKIIQKCENQKFSEKFLVDFKEKNIYYEDNEL